MPQVPLRILQGWSKRLFHTQGPHWRFSLAHLSITCLCPSAIVFMGERVTKGGPFSTSLTPHLHSNELFASPAGIQILSFAKERHQEREREDTMRIQAPGKFISYTWTSKLYTGHLGEPLFIECVCTSEHAGSPFDNWRVIYSRAEKCNSPLECSSDNSQGPSVADHPAPILNQFSTLPSVLFESRALLPCIFIKVTFCLRPECTHQCGREISCCFYIFGAMGVQNAAGAAVHVFVNVLWWWLCNTENFMSHPSLLVALRAFCVHGEANIVSCVNFFLVYFCV